MLLDLHEVFLRVRAHLYERSCLDDGRDGFPLPRVLAHALDEDRVLLLGPAAGRSLHRRITATACGDFFLGGLHLCGVGVRQIRGFAVRGSAGGLGAVPGAAAIWPSTAT